MPVGTPLIDAEYADDAIAALFGWFAFQMPHVEALIMALVAQDGATARALRKVAASRGLFTTGFASHERGLLVNDGDPEDPLAAAISAKRARKYRRLQRRLAERGELAHVVATSQDTCRDALEEFLALEAQGWKGARGSALLRNASLTTFARTMVRSLSGDGQCRINSLRLDGRMIASCIVLHSGGQAYLWKMTYDEAFGAYSPGTLLMLAISRAHLADSRIIATDSCSDADNELINRLWPHKVAFFDLMVATQPSGIGAGEAIARRETLRRVLRSHARDVYTRLFRR
jgi:CelD/BcsL family acetyltransferase involved in cellulose biosynthesis